MHTEVMMECDNCGCKVDGRPMRIFMRDLDGNEYFIDDIALCPDGVNDNTDCTSDYITALRKEIININEQKMNI